MTIIAVGHVLDHPTRKRSWGACPFISAPDREVFGMEYPRWREPLDAAYVMLLVDMGAARYVGCTFKRGLERREELCVSVIDTLYLAQLEALGVDVLPGLRMIRDASDLFDGYLYSVQQRRHVVEAQQAQVMAIAALAVDRGELAGGNVDLADLAECTLLCDESEALAWFVNRHNVGDDTIAWNCRIRRDNNREHQEPAELEAHYRRIIKSFG